MGTERGCCSSGQVDLVRLQFPNLLDSDGYIHGNGKVLLPLSAPFPTKTKINTTSADSVPTMRTDGPISSSRSSRTNSTSMSRGSGSGEAGVKAFYTPGKFEFALDDIVLPPRVAMRVKGNGEGRFQRISCVGRIKLLKIWSVITITTTTTTTTKHET